MGSGKGGGGRAGKGGGGKAAEPKLKWRRSTGGRPLATGSDGRLYEVFPKRNGKFSVRARLPGGPGLPWGEFDTEEEAKRSVERYNR